MSETFTNDLLDLKDHCMLCFRSGRVPGKVVNLEGSGTETGAVEVEDDRKELFPNDRERSLCKRFLTLSTRHLNLPPARLSVAEEGVATPRPIQKRWEDLITAGVCGTCVEMVKEFCDVYRQLDYLKMQLGVKLHDLEKYIYLTDHDRSCAEGRSVLKSKWDAEGHNSNLLMELIKMFRADIVAKAATMMKFPVVSVQRGVPSSEQTDFLIPQTTSNTETCDRDTMEKEHRPSIEDSGVSELSPHSVSAYDEYMETDNNTQAAVKKSEISTNAKEFTMRRRVFKCKKCEKKFFVREKLVAHSLEAHPKLIPTIDNNLPLMLTEKEPKEPFERKLHKIRKTAYVCPAENCSDKFLARRNFIDHMNNRHPNIPYSFAWPQQFQAGSPAKGNLQQANVEKFSRPTKKSDGQQRRRYLKRNISCSVEGCFQKFHNADELVRHSHNHRSHACYFCGESCSNGRALAIHEYKSHRGQDSSKVRCPRCGENSKVFSKYFAYIAHFTQTHLDVQGPLPQCSNCNAVFATRASWEEHSAKCTHQSGMNSDSSNVLVVAEVKTEPERIASRYACNICTLACSSFAALQTHIIARHDPNLQFCNDCERAFKTSEALHKHRAFFHLKLKVFVRFCRICDKKITFKSVAQFNSHLKQHESGKTKSQRKKKNRLRNRAKQCSICHKKFRSLQQHMRVHGKKSEERNINAQDESSVDVDETSSSSTEQKEQGPRRNQRSPQRSLPDRVKLRERNLNISSEDGSEEEDTDDIAKPKREKKRRNSVDTQSVNASSARKQNAVLHVQLQNHIESSNVTSFPPEYESIIDVDTPETIEISSSPSEPLPAMEHEENSGDSIIVISPLELRNASSVRPASIPVGVATPIKEETTTTTTTTQSTAQKLQNWLLATNLSQNFNVTKNTGENPTRHQTPGVPPLSSYQQVNPGASVVDCIDISDDDDDNTEQKPDISSTGLSQRVKNWLTDRKFGNLPPEERSEQVDVITLD